MKHSVRDEGVVGSNPITPTNYALEALISRNYQHRLVIERRLKYTSAYTVVCCEWSSYAKIARATTSPASASRMNTLAFLKTPSRMPRSHSPELSSSVKRRCGPKSGERY